MENPHDKNSESITSQQSLTDAELYAESIVELKNRHKIATILLTSPEHCVYGDILDVILDSFGSVWGYFGIINSEGDLSCPSMTREIWDKCNIPNKEILFPRSAWGGLWGRSLLEKCPLVCNHGLRLPVGHIPLSRAMAVPIHFQGIVIGQIVVANKSSDYSSVDMKRMESLSDFIAPILSARIEKNKAEIALHENEKMLQRMIDAVLESVFLMEKDGTVLSLNKTVAQRLGFKRNELLGQNMYNYIPIDLGERRRVFVEKAAIERQPVFFEDERMGRNILNTIYPVVDDDGQVNRFAIVGYDITDRKRIENQLERAYRLLEETQAISHLGGWEYDTVTQKFTWSKEVYRIYGVIDDFDPNDLDRVISFYQKDKAIIEEAFKACVETGVPYNLELQFVKFNGERIWVQTSGLPVIENGKVIRVAGNIMDISERKRTEEILNQQSAFIRNIFDSNDASMAVVDHSGRITDINAAWRRFALANNGGDENSWGIGVFYFTDLSENGDSTNAKEAFEGIRKVQAGILPYFEIEYPCHSPAAKRWFVMRAMPVTEKPGTVLISHQDITKLKMSEEALKNQNQKLTEMKEIINRSGYVAIVWHLVAEKWPIEIVSGNIEKLTGYSPDDFTTGKIQWTRITHPDDLPRLEKEVDNYLRSGIRRWSNEYRIIRKDGEIRWFLDDNLTLENSCGEIDRIQGIIRDITDQKAVDAEKDKLKAQNQLLQKTESLGRMAGGIAHLFNNQLSVVLGHLELAMEELAAHPITRGHLSIAFEAARKSANVSRLMLNYIGQGIGKIELINLSSCCRDSLELLSGTLTPGVSLHFIQAEHDMAVNANFNQMLEVVTQLIQNGVEAIGNRSGTVSITLKKIGSAEVPKAGLHPPDWRSIAKTFACIEIADTGTGIPEPDMDRLFDPFFTTKFPGRGLGLAVVIGFVKAWGGAISVVSRENHGTIFSVFIPLPAVQKSNAIPKADEESVCQGKGGTILLVDDQDIVRNTAALLLKHLGYSVFPVSNGAEAVDLLGRDPDGVHCAITDLSMPGMDGWQTLAALRKIKPDLPVILSSGYDEANALKEFSSEQPNVFLHKPYSRDELQKAIVKAMR